MYWGIAAEDDMSLRRQVSHYPKCPGVQRSTESLCYIHTHVYSIAFLEIYAPVMQENS